MRVKRSARWQSPLLATLALILLIVTASFVASGRINAMEERRSLENLYQEAAALAQQIETQAASDREQLEMLATVAASFSDLRDARLWGILDSYESVGMMSNLALLLPDGTVLLGEGAEIDAGAALSFSEIAAQGAHISGRERSLLGGGGVLRHYMPVVRDGETAAMLYGVIDLSVLPEELALTPYGGAAAVYIIDGESGDFLLDTWHAGEELGNFWDMGDRPTAPGYDNASCQQELFDGVSGHVVFLSNTSGGYLYFHYAPMRINQWRLALSVPEETVFFSAHQIRAALNALLALESLGFLLYLFWMLRYVRRDAMEKQRQVDAINKVYDVARLLFGAHEHPENIAPALKQIADNCGGGAAAFWVSGLGESGSAFAWPDAGGRAPDYFPALLEHFRAGQAQFEAHEPAALPCGAAEGLHSLAAVPLEGAGGELCGLLAVENPARGRSACALLRSVSFSFSMLCQNLCGYSAIRVRGETDALTGLLNRNRYERDLQDFRQWYQRSLACVYFDANGLHELNNAQGHDAGDAMLRSVAAEILRRFGKAHSYRIGGDEFVVFAPDLPEEEVLRLFREMEAALLKENIHISAGVQWAEEIRDFGGFVQAAEMKMYAAKRAYYEHQEHDRRGRGRSSAR